MKGNLKEVARGSRKEGSREECSTQRNCMSKGREKTGEGCLGYS